MSSKLRDLFKHPALAIGSTVLWGLLELVALTRSRWATRLRHGR
jgi:hypothetical protein